MTQKAYSEMSREERKHAVEEAERILRAEYYTEVHALMLEFLVELEEKDDVPVEDLQEEAYNLLHQLIDGHEFVIYTFQAQKCLLFSENQDAYVEEVGDEVQTESGSIPWSTLAYYALYADVRDRLDAHGFNWEWPRMTLRECKVCSNLTSVQNHEKFGGCCCEGCRDIAEKSA